MTDQARRFSDEEFAAIIRAAQELQERDAESGGASVVPAGLAAGGMSMKEIEAVASEVGLEPAYVRRAAAIMTADRPQVSSNPLLGGPANFSFRASVPGRVDPFDFPRLADAIRHELGQHGETNQIQDSLEWKLDNQATELAVSIIPSQQETMISVVADRGTSAMLCYVFSMMPWLIIGVGVGNGLDANLIGGLSIMAGAATGGYVTGRAIWATASRKFMDKMRRLTGALARESGSLARRAPNPPEIEGADDD